MKTENAQSANWDFNPEQLGGYVPASVAKQMLNCKNTTLYNLRKNHKVVWSTIGAKVFYQVESIKKLLNENKKGE